MPQVPKVLTIAGTDPTGGAGIQADLKTFQECEAYGMSAITSVLAQNTTGVQQVEHMSLELLQAQLDSVFDDIMPDAIKTGMIATPAMIRTTVNMLKKHELPVVIDPVMVATSGDSLAEEETLEVMKREFLPTAAVVTPNMAEAANLTDLPVHTLEDMEAAAKKIVDELGARAALVKGGHMKEDAVDILYVDGDIHYFRSPRTDTKHTHGTGCTLSAAIAAKLARGKSIYLAVQESKEYITNAISNPLEIGKGNGPVNHWGARVPLDQLLK
ncbi:bifunctional hydroxymethylpyrimidine kinase/phosphomethylpyrimidine kinase [Marinococcus halophilus]|uniref:Hydroxymethylpyrimidine/phosphomethylpyrimidine kinase n=1 Tax=Marinococcus halophilus TaxID=1371 RepID=A0A510Y2K0_MARHA|nr:bifunctional hydroxymethylpyrimidine kinase/phosphomethylpyrimidine kinase [Marinococcus halophilus]OZT81579.1 bifunctional hydroxymethylpyrimidine kinase/phosphomethylpyrimidine kinase [Marinococcus halophilus]GEK57524.1 hydroxymethylpyrimidine/phosphomethylpyrimidine kinase [Marinococcus halophilus]